MACRFYLSHDFLRNVTLTFFVLCAASLCPHEAASQPDIQPKGETVTMFWTAPGDDGLVGQAFMYDIRCSTLEVGSDTAAWWDAADTCTGEPAPAPAGRRQSFVVIGLDPEQVYYFAVRTADECLNWSEISNIYSNKYFAGADINDDGEINILDVIYLLDYFYRNGPSPEYLSSADINGDGAVDILDVSYLVDYLFRGGPEPA
jgi:hypothetical protein